MEHISGMVVLYLWFWLAYRVYFLKEDYKDIRKYIMGDDTKDRAILEARVEEIRNSALRIVPEGMTKVFVALATIIGMVYYSIDILGLVIAIIHVSFPTYIYWGILVLMGVLAVRVIRSGFEIPTLFLLIVHSDASMAAIDRLLKRKFPVRLPKLMLVIIHLLCLVVAIYLVSQFM